MGLIIIRTICIVLDYLQVFLYNVEIDEWQREVCCMKYTPEQKAEALESIDRVGVAKTAENLKISTQTLYKWRSDGNKAQPADVIEPNTSAAKALLANDRIMQDKIESLEAEVKNLRAIVARYRVALSAVLEGEK